MFLTVARVDFGRVLYCDLVARAGKELLPWCRVCVPLWVFGPEVWGKPKGVSTVGQVFGCCLADVVAEVFRGLALESPVGSGVRACAAEDIARRGRASGVSSCAVPRGWLCMCICSWNLESAWCPQMQTWGGGVAGGMISSHESGVFPWRAWSRFRNSLLIRVWSLERPQGCPEVHGHMVGLCWDSYPSWCWCGESCIPVRYRARVNAS